MQHGLFPTFWHCGRNNVPYYPRSGGNSGGNSGGDCCDCRPYEEKVKEQTVDAFDAGFRADCQRTRLLKHGGSAWVAENIACVGNDHAVFGE